MEDRTPVLVSACLTGLKTRYDGESAFTARILEMCRERPCLPLCPEQLGGLPTPREAAFLTDGAGAEVLDGSARLIWRPSGRDVTAAFVRGARETAALVEALGIREAYLKTRSPSCGIGEVAVGRGRMPGDGVTASLLRRMGCALHPVEKDA